MNKVGIVSSVQPEDGTAKVIFEESGTTVSYTLPVMVRGSLHTKDYWLPEPNEQVICCFMGQTNPQGYILGSFYSQKDRPPIASTKIRRLQFGDGAFIEYNQETQEFILDFQQAPRPGKLIVRNGQVLDQ